MRLTNRFALRSPGLTRLRDGLVRTCLILTPHGNTYAFSDAVRKFDEPLFSSVRGSTTVTTPALRFRCAVPVGHHVRVRWYELPASSSTRRMVLVPTVGKPPRRNFRCKVLSDHVAVPSTRRLGDRWAVATIRARALGTYLCLRPRPAAISSAANPWPLNRLTRSATVVPLRKPANRAARMNGLPCATARIAVARRTRSTRSQPALTMRSNAACSDPLMARNGSRCGVGIPGLPSPQSIRPPLQLRPYTA